MSQFWHRVDAPDNIFSPFRPPFFSSPDSSQGGGFQNYAVPKAIVVGLLRIAAVHDGRFLNRRAHRPVKETVFLEILDQLVVKVRLETVSTDVLNDPVGEVFINLGADDVFVRSRAVGGGRHGLLTSSEFISRSGQGP